MAIATSCVTFAVGENPERRAQCALGATVYSLRPAEAEPYQELTVREIVSQGEGTEDA
jgi:hypothetical protein